FEKMKYALYYNITCIKKLDCMEAEKAEAERVCVAAEVQAVVAEESAIAARDSFFEGFNWNFVDLRDSVID
ncbi:hypothetical protein M406DRAFT_249582, partial [Cryphonectria parasitica EP155]